MAALLGVDAGGSKALFALSDAEGRVIKTLRRPGVTPPNMSEGEINRALSDGARQILNEAGVPFGELSAVAVGMPCFGESDSGDASILRAADSAFEGIPHMVVNDSQVAWAGSFALEPGINVVCGTGTIAFGVDDSGKTARCGGWSYHFSDEGSGYWLGKKLLELFCKQSDGRIPYQGAVYELVRERFSIRNDFEIIDRMEADYIPHRDKVADLQRLLFEAAALGDESAISCYREAGREIALCVQGILSRLRFEGPVKVSYSGGIFNVGALVMESFEGELARMNCSLTRPIAPPYAGALMMALRLSGLSMTEALTRLTKCEQ